VPELDDGEPEVRASETGSDEEDGAWVEGIADGAAGVGNPAVLAAGVEGCEGRPGGYAIACEAVGRVGAFGMNGGGAGP